MRLIGILQQEQQAFAFSSFLIQHGIDSRYDKTSEALFQIWVVDEDAFDAAMQWYERFCKNPEDPIFTTIEKVEPEILGPQNQTVRPKGFKVRVNFRPGIPRFPFTLTNFLIALCVCLFIWTSTQQSQVIKTRGQLAAQIGFSPVQDALMFDFPYAIEKLGALLEKYPLQSLEDLKKEPLEVQQEFAKVDTIPMWPGIVPLILEWKKTGFAYIHQAPLFEKIREGEVWRLITPVLLHGNFFHILFNMAWLWLLGKQMEQRIGKGKMLLAILLMGVVSNVCQYLMSGPFFLGFSGIIVGMAGFIWMRQRIAPWEGYSVQKGTFVFLFFFLIAMVGLDLFSFLLQLMHVASPIPNIANTAHIVGGLIGIGLARIHLFARGLK